MEQDTSLTGWQRLAMAMMGSLVVLTFAMTNLYGTWWQLSDWLVATVLPTVVVDLTNEERDDVAAPPLRRNALLDAAATMKAEHMAAHGYFAHYAPDGTTPWYFFEEVGYVYAHAGENLAVHFNDSSAVVAAWMRSPSHRENIVNQQFSEIGIGVARGRYQGYDTVFVVQLFGTPAAPPPVVEMDLPTVDALATAEPTIPAVTATQSTSTPETAATPVVAAAQSDEVVTIRPIEEPLSLDATPSNLVEADAVLVSDPTDAIAISDIPEEEPVIALDLEQTAVAAPMTELQTTFMTISSGLPAIPIAYAEVGTSGTTATGLATQPSRLLQIVYTVFSLVVVWLLVTSVLRDMQRQQLVRVGYSAILLLLMAGLVYVHVQLTSMVVVA